MVDVDFVVLIGTILFFAAMHQWPVDGRRWESRSDAQPDTAQPVAAAVDEPEPQAHVTDRAA